MTARRCQRLLVVVIALGLSAAAAGAQATYYEAYALGLEHARAGRFDDARTALLRAVELRPEPGTKLRTYGLNFLDRYQPYLALARVALELGRLDEAEQHLRQAAARGVAPKRKIAVLAARLGQMREAARRAAAVSSPDPFPAPFLRVTSEPPGADLWVDGRAVGTTPQTLETLAGEHRLELRLAGYRERRTTVKVSASGTTDEHFVLEAVPPPAVEKLGSPAATAGESGAAVEPRQAIAVPAAAPPTAIEKPAIDQRSLDLGTTAGPKETSSAATVAASSAAGGEAGAGGTEGGGEEVGDSAAPPIRIAERGPQTPVRSERRRPRWQISVAAAALLLLLALVGSWRWSRRGRPGATASIALSEDDLERAPTLRIGRAAPLPEVTRSDFGGYRLSGLLGVGGMARTYLATRARDGLQVAIKVPHEHLLADNDSRVRFLREGRLGATLHHPNIVRIYEAAEVGGWPFIAMELLEGETLETVLNRQGQLAVEPALGVARGIAQALDYAHLKGVVHRDLKPDNVMLLQGNEVKVMDYGIARVLDAPGVTATGTYLGTPIYSAPESIRAKAVDQRSDLYSLGIILFHMLAGKVPFSSTDPLELLMMHVREPLPPLPQELDLPPAVGEIMARLTAKRPEDRCPSAEMLLRDLDRLLNSL